MEGLLPNSTDLSLMLNYFSALSPKRLVICRHNRVNVSILWSYYFCSKGQNTNITVKFSLNTLHNYKWNKHKWNIKQHRKRRITQRLKLNRIESEYIVKQVPGYYNSCCHSIARYSFVYSPRGTKNSVACIALLILPGFKGFLSRNIVHIYCTSSLQLQIHNTYIYPCPSHSHKHILLSFYDTK